MFTSSAGEILRIRADLTYSQKWAVFQHLGKLSIYADQLKSCLDLISTDIPSVHTRSTEPLGKSDHVAIVGYMQTSLGSDTSDSRQIWCWSKANTNDLRDEVSSRNWTDVLDAEDVTIACRLGRHVSWKSRSSTSRDVSSRALHAVVPE